MPTEPSSQQLQSRFGSVTDWIIEWQMAGIRVQVIRRGGKTFVWSSDEELLTDRFPEVVNSADSLPDGTVLDGDLIGWKSGRTLPLSELHKRLTRKSGGRKLLAEVPVLFLASDLLEAGGVDIRQLPLSERRTRLELLSATQPSGSASPFVMATRLTPVSWDACRVLHSSCREHSAEGLVLKRADSNYGVGGLNETWWHWKATLFHCSAVLLYAHRASAGRAGKFMEYTFAVWNDGELVPLAKTPASLSDVETSEISEFIRANTLERFGPVCSVKPELVFELSFEGVQVSTRHKAGLTIRSSQVIRWQRQRKPAEADSLAAIRSLIGE